MMSQPPFLVVYSFRPLRWTYWVSHTELYLCSEPKITIGNFSWLAVYHSVYKLCNVQAARTLLDSQSTWPLLLVAFASLLVSFVSAKTLSHITPWENTHKKQLNRVVESAWCLPANCSGDNPAKSTLTINSILVSYDSWALGDRTDKGNILSRTRNPRSNKGASALHISGEIW
jgi:hypothetical protein